MRQVLGPGALGRPRGIGWRGRWEGGLGWGIHVTLWLIHVNVWQNPLKCCEVISLQLIKINEKKKKDACRVPQITWLIQELTSGLLAPQQWFSYHTLSFPDTIQIASLCASDEDYHTLPLGTVVFTSSPGVHTSKGTSEVQGSEKSCEFFPFS